MLTCLVPASVAGRHSAAASSTAVVAPAAAVDAEGGGNGAAAASSSNSRSGAEDAVLKALLALRPTSDLRQQRLLLSTLSALPSLRSSYVRLRAGSSPAMEPKASRAWLTQLAFTCHIARVTLGGREEQQQHAVETAELTSAISAPSGGSSSAASALPTISPHHGSDAASDLAMRPPTDGLAASSLLDGLLPGALSRAFWTKALLHTNVLVRLYAANALLVILPLLQKLTAPLASAAAAPHESPDGVASAGLRLLTTELQRRLPDLQVLLKLRSAQHAAADKGGGGNGRDKLAHLLEARMLEALRFYAILFPSMAAEAASHAEKLLRQHGAHNLAPIGRYHALLLLRERSTASSRSHPESSADDGNSLLQTLPTLVDTVVLPPATELGSLLRLGISPQPPALRQPLWSYIHDQITRCGALHLAARAEAHAWLQSIRSDEDADCLAALLHMCLNTLHASVDRSTDLTAKLAAADGLQLDDDDTLSCSGGLLRLSPLALTALMQMKSLADASCSESLQSLAYLCRVLSSIGAAHPSLGRLVHAGMLQHGLGDGPSSTDEEEERPRKKAKKGGKKKREEPEDANLHTGWRICAKMLKLLTPTTASSVRLADHVVANGIEAPAAEEDEEEGPNETLDVPSQFTCLYEWDCLLRSPTYDGTALVPLFSKNEQLRSYWLGSYSTDERADKSALNGSLTILSAWLRAHLATAGPPF